MLNLMAILFAALQTAQVVLSPLSGWQLTTSPYPCAIARAFGVDGKQLVLELKPEGFDPGYVISIVGPAKLVPMVQGTKALSLTTRDGTKDSPGFTRETADGRRLLRATLSLDALNALSADTADLTIAAGKVTLSFPQSAIGKATAALRDCHRDALNAFGVDPELWFSGRTAKPVNPGRFFEAKDYPEGLPRGVMGDVVALLSTDASGKPTGCRAISAPHPLLGQKTCEIAIRHVPSRPAIDAAGAAISGYGLMTISWRR